MSFGFTQTLSKPESTCFHDRWKTYEKEDTRSDDESNIRPISKAACSEKNVRFFGLNEIESLVICGDKIHWAIRLNR
jgi:hypothetical protein